ncbi:MAG: rhomboid family intramembrane serine protease [Flavobacteriales bacterium]|nr:rhomboid family intramembrane serine protease [Flavobacteriales bacterium]
MFPYHDENKTQRTPYVTFVLIGINVLAWLLVQGAGSAYELAMSVCNFGLVPGEFTGNAEPGSGFLMAEDLACVVDPGHQYHTVLTSMFMHGSWMHLLGNMWFLWLFGNNVEDSMTRPRFVLFYLLCGLGAALLQVYTDPASVIPMVGASGAISGVMGAYLLLFPRVKVFVFVPLGFIPFNFALPAWTMLLYWFGLQLLGGFGGVMNETSGGVAFWAHVGGFAAGLLLIKLFACKPELEAHRHGHWQPAPKGRVVRW